MGILERLQWLKPWQRVAVAVVSFAVSLLAFCYLFGSPILATIIIGSVALHELSHLAAYRCYGIKAGVVFLPFYAGITYTAEGQDLQLCRKSKLVWAAFAGLICNLTIGVVALIAGAFTHDLLWILVSMLNLALLLFNIAPGIGSDGQLVVSIVTTCPIAKRSKRAIRIINLTGIGAIVGTHLLISSVRVDPSIGAMVLVFFTLDLLSRWVHRKREIQSIPEGLTESEALKFALIYSGLVVTTLVGFWLLPLSY